MELDKEEIKMIEDILNELKSINGKLDKFERPIEELTSKEVSEEWIESQIASLRKLDPYGNPV